MLNITIIKCIVLRPHCKWGAILPKRTHPTFLECWQLSIEGTAYTSNTYHNHNMSLDVTCFDAHQHSIDTSRLQWNKSKNKCAFVTMQTCIQTLRTSYASTSHRAFFLSAWFWALKTLLMQTAQQLTMPQRSGRLESPWQKRKRFEPPMEMCRGSVSGNQSNVKNQV